MRFTDGHSSSGICTPSRYALLTGRHHWRDFHGIVNAFGGSVFKPERLTLPEMLKEKGYATAAIGKWHLGWDWDAIRKPGAKADRSRHRQAEAAARPRAFDWSKPIPDGPLAHGFDHYFGDTVINFPPYAGSRTTGSSRRPTRSMDTDEVEADQGRQLGVPARPDGLGLGPLPEYPDHHRQGRSSSSRAQAGPRNRSSSTSPSRRPTHRSSPTTSLTANPRPAPTATSSTRPTTPAASCSRPSRNPGRRDNTIVIFTADNGPEKYAYARDEKFDHWSAHPLRGLKRDIYEGGHHVPFMIRCPGVDAGREHLGRPRFADRPHGDHRGRARVRAARQECRRGLPQPAPAARRAGVRASVRTTHVHNTTANRYAIRHGDWVLIDAKNGYLSGRNKAWEAKHGYPADDGSAAELYNLKSDPGQRKNLASDHPERISELRALLNQLRKQGHSAPRFDHQ